MVRFSHASKAKLIEGIEKVIRRIVESGGKVGNGVHRDRAELEVDGKAEEYCPHRYKVMTM